jgi:hypothetical protein
MPLLIKGKDVNIKSKVVRGKVTKDRRVKVKIVRAQAMVGIIKVHKATKDTAKINIRSIKMIRANLVMVKNRAMNPKAMGTDLMDITDMVQTNIMVMMNDPIMVKIDVGVGMVSVMFIDAIMATPKAGITIMAIDIIVGIINIGTMNMANIGRIMMACRVLMAKAKCTMVKVI